jgi:predicted phage terminase large subunit-like protein
MLNERMDIVDTMRAINSFNAKHPKALVKLVEDKANGPAVIRLLRNEIPGLIAVNPEGGKIARANAVLGAVESGNVYIPVPEEAPWVEAYISQHASFPNGKNDDMVDSTTQALNRLIYNRSTRPPKEEKTLIQKHKEKLYKQQKRKRRSYM